MSHYVCMTLLLKSWSQWSWHDELDDFYKGGLGGLLESEQEDTSDEVEGVEDLIGV